MKKIKYLCINAAGAMADDEVFDCEPPAVFVQLGVYMVSTDLVVDPLGGSIVLEDEYSRTRPDYMVNACMEYVNRYFIPMPVEIE